MELTQDRIKPEVFTGLYDTQKRAYLRTISVNEVEKGQDMISAICEHLQVDISDVLSANRSRKIALARQVCMHFLKHNTKLSLVQIGKLLGNRDHSTVIYGLETYQDIFDTDRGFKLIIVDLKKTLNL